MGPLAQRREVEAEPSSERGQAVRLRYGRPGAPHIPDTSCQQRARRLFQVVSTARGGGIACTYCSLARLEALQPFSKDPSPLEPKPETSESSASKTQPKTHPQAFTPRARAPGRYRRHPTTWPHPQARDTRGLQIPGAFEEDAGVGVWSMGNGLPPLPVLKDFDGLEYEFATGTVDALEPGTLTKIRSTRLVSMAFEKTGEVNIRWDKVAVTELTRGARRTYSNVPMCQNQTVDSPNSRPNLAA